MTTTTRGTEVPTRPTRPARRAGLRGGIGRHPLIWFFPLAYLLSWAAWLPYVQSEDGRGILRFGFPSVLGTTQLPGVLPGAHLGPILVIWVTFVRCKQHAWPEWSSWFSSTTN